MTGSLQHDLVEIAISFLVSYIVGALFYLVIGFKVSDPARAGTIVGLALSFLCFLMHRFKKLRIYLLLALPDLLTGGIRALLMILVIFWAFRGPAKNVLNNINMAATGMACLEAQVKDVAREVSAGESNFGQMAIDKAKEFLNVTIGPIQKLRSVLERIDHSLDKMLAWKRGMISQIKQALADCDLYSRAPYYKCISTLDDVYYKCLDKSYEVLCAPVKFLKNICYLGRVLTLGCEWPSALRDQLEEGVDSLVRKTKQEALEAVKNSALFDLYEIVAVDYSFNTSQQLRAKEIHRFGDAMKDEVRWILKVIDVIIWLLDKISIPIMLLPLIRAFRYGWSYERKVDTGNYFINGAFEKIDAERKKRSRPTLLPLTASEEKEYIRWWTPRLVTSEIPGLVRSLYLTIVPAIVPLVFVIVDTLSYRLLYLCYRFLHSDLIKLPRPSMYELKIAGTGYISMLLSGVMRTFEPVTEYTDNQDVEWRRCLSEPSAPDYPLFAGMLGVLICCVLLCFLKVMAKRTLQFIAGRYWPERRNLRAEHLYRKLYDARRPPQLPEGTDVIDLNSEAGDLD